MEKEPEIVLKEEEQEWATGNASRNEKNCIKQAVADSKWHTNKDMAMYARFAEG